MVSGGRMKCRATLWPIGLICTWEKGQPPGVPTTEEEKGDFGGEEEDLLEDFEEEDPWDMGEQQEEEGELESEYEAVDLFVPGIREAIKAGNLSGAVATQLEGMLDDVEGETLNDQLSARLAEVQSDLQTDEMTAEQAKADAIRYVAGEVTARILYDSNQFHRVAFYQNSSVHVDMNNSERVYKDGKPAFNEDGTPKYETVDKRLYEADDKGQWERDPIKRDKEVVAFGEHDHLDEEENDEDEKDEGENCGNPGA